MRSKMETHSDEAEKRVRDIRRATRRQFSAEEKVRIVIAGLRGEDSVAELCRKEGRRRGGCGTSSRPQLARQCSSSRSRSRSCRPGS